MLYLSRRSSTVFDLLTERLALRRPCGRAGTFVRAATDTSQRELGNVTLIILTCDYNEACLSSRRVIFTASDANGPGARFAFTREFLSESTRVVRGAIFIKLSATPVSTSMARGKSEGCAVTSLRLLHRSLLFYGRNGAPTAKYFFLFRRARPYRSDISSPFCTTRAIFPSEQIDWPQTTRPLNPARFLPVEKSTARLSRTQW